MLILSGFSSPSASAKGSTFNPDHSRRWALLAKPTLGVALAMGVLTAGQAQAMVVNLGEQDWYMTTFSGTFNENTNFAITNNALVWPIVDGGQTRLAVVPIDLGRGGSNPVAKQVCPERLIRYGGNPTPGPWCDWDADQRDHLCALWRAGTNINWGDWYCMNYPSKDPLVGIDWRGYISAGINTVNFNFINSNILWNPEPGTGGLVFNPTTGQPFFTNTLVPIDAVWTLSTPFSTSSSTPVPGPLPALGAAAAFGFSRKLRKRIKRSSDAVSSTYSL
jgi:hypothetical protein